jgi:NAD-dependent SIR2 family protein deacetylase
MSRDEFQSRLSKLNPRWATFLEELLQSGALDTENPDERRQRGYRTNPDGDTDVPGAPYTTFRYPACPTCLKRAPVLTDGSKGRVEVDADGAWSPLSDAGILKPNVIMFGESIPTDTKVQAEEAIDEASRVLVVGSSLATYSAFRLVKKAHEQGRPIGILNLGGVRNEAALLGDYEDVTDSKAAVRASLAAEDVLPEVLKIL